jgi:cell division protease FtsH
MSGPAAEEYVFGMLSTGVESDLDEATKMAHAMVALCGVSPAIGPVTIGEKPGEVFIGRALAHMGNLAAKTLELVDGETRRIVREAEETELSGPALGVILEGVLAWPEPLLEHTNGSTQIRMREAVAASEAETEAGM